MPGDPAYLVIPAAGLGTRMQAVHPALPKEMLPVGTKPAIQYAVEEGYSAGIENIVIIINRNKEIVREYFENRTVRKTMFPGADRGVEEVRKRCSITFLYQERPRGECDAIGCAEHLIGSSSLAVIYPDNIYSPAPGALKLLKPVFNTYRKDTVALMEVTKENAHGTGNSGRVDIRRLDNNLYTIERFHPKSTGDFTLRFHYELRACGIYITGNYLFDYLRRLRPLVQEPEFTDGPVRDAILEEKGCLGYRIPGTVFDIGSPAGYELCLKNLR